MHEVVNDNSNHYRIMVMDAIRMNRGDACECSIIDKEQNTYTTRFFDILKNFDKSLWDGCTNHDNLSVIAQVFTIKLDYELSEASYDKIVE